MKINIPILASLIALCALMISPEAQAGRGGGGGRGNAKKEPPKPQFQAIDSVNVAARTITVSYVNTANPSTKTLKIIDRTEIEVNGNKATINDLKPGMKITVGIGMDADTAARLVASPRPPDPTPAPKK